MLTPSDCEFRVYSKGYSCAGDPGYPCGTTYLPGDEPGWVCSESGEFCEEGLDVEEIGCNRFEQTNILCPECWKHDLEESEDNRSYNTLSCQDGVDYFCPECDEEYSGQDFKQVKPIYESELEKFVQDFINKFANSNIGADSISDVDFGLMSCFLDISTGNTIAVLFDFPSEIEMKYVGVLKTILLKIIKKDISIKHHLEKMMFEKM